MLHDLGVRLILRYDLYSGKYGIYILLCQWCYNIKFIYASLAPGIVAADVQLQNNKCARSAAQSLQPAGLPISVNIVHYPCF